MRERILFTYNPNAGTKAIQSKLYEVVNLLTGEERELIISPTRKRGDAEEAVKEYMKRDHIVQVVCSGGDGTLHEVVNGMMVSENKVPISYIPAGSTNDFGYSLNIPKDTLKAAVLSMEGQKFPVDIGQFQDKYFVYTAAFGMFTEVSYATPQNLKNIFGHMAYLLKGAASLSNLTNHHMKVTYDGNVVEDDFLFGMVVNSESIGGFRGITGTDVCLNDGFNEMMLIRDCKTVDLPGLGMDILSKNLNNKNIIYAKVKNVTFESTEPVAWTMDGEYGGTLTEANIQVHNKAVSFMIPKNLFSIMESS